MRNIPLKEHPPNSHGRYLPSHKDREASDETLGGGPFVGRGTADGYLYTGNERPDAVKNLIMLGGSFVESQFVEERSRFPSIIERSLPDAWRVLNGGQSEMNSLNMLSLLSAKIPPSMTPGSKLLIFIDQTDRMVMNQQGVYWSVQPTITPISPEPATTFSPWEPYEAVERVIEALLSTADAFGFEYGVISSPFREGDFSNDEVLRNLHRRQRARYERALEQRRFVQDVSRQAAERRGRPCLDGQAQVKPQHFYDSVHLNSGGQIVFAAALSYWLTEWI